MNKEISTTKIALFKGKKIRKTIYQNEWWFVIMDVVAALTDSIQPDGYIKDMRRRDPELAKGWGQIATPLSVQTEGGYPVHKTAQSKLSKGWVQIVHTLNLPINTNLLMADQL